MTATNMCYNFVGFIGFRYSSPRSEQLMLNFGGGGGGKWEQ